jgi:hypothetical protein
MQVTAYINSLKDKVNNRQMKGRKLDEIQSSNKICIQWDFYH